jgi:hypothetical protein
VKWEAVEKGYSDAIVYWYKLEQCLNRPNIKYRSELKE